jgi:hypothetical protein
MAARKGASFTAPAGGIFAAYPTAEKVVYGEDTLKGVTLAADTNNIRKRLNPTKPVLSG